MGFYRIVISYLKSYSMPIMRSVFKAYKHNTSGANQGGDQQSSSKKSHPMDDFLKGMLSKTNLSAPPLDQMTALKILNIELQKEKQLDPKYVLDRYWTLYKKNDPKIGGTPYLQSKVFAAKQFLMSQIPNSTQIQQEFYKQVVQPEEKAQRQEAQGQKQQKQENQENKQKQSQNKQK